MVQYKSERTGCVDAFNASLVALASYAGFLEFPIIEPTNWIPNKLIPFSKAVSNRDYDQWVHFYEHDYLFERLWRNPKRYFKILERYNGVILPDFSTYRDMPLAMQLWNIYRSRAIGHWLQRNGVKVIVNVRWGDWRTQHFCCDGISRGCTIAIGSLGCIGDAEDRRHFAEGLAVVAERLAPKTIVVYGAAPKDIFEKYREAGISILQFDGNTSAVRARMQ